MKFNRIPEFDPTDRAILNLLQDNCKQPLSAIGEKVGLSAPAVIERIHKLEEAGVITSYVALVDARRLGKDVTAFLGLSSDQPRSIASLERHITAIDDVLECHHITGAHTFLLKVKTANTGSLERLIEEIRALEGVNRTETMVVLSTAVERPRIALELIDEFVPRPPRRGGAPRARTGQRR